MDPAQFVMLTPQQQQLIGALVSSMAATRTAVTNNANSGFTAYAPAHSMRLHPPNPGQQMFAGPSSGPSLVGDLEYHAHAVMPNTTLDRVGGRTI
jgi:hypothetical protein